MLYTIENISSIQVNNHDPNILIYVNDDHQIVTETKNIDNHVSMNEDKLKLLTDLK